MQHKNNLTVLVNKESLIRAVQDNLAGHKDAVAKARVGFEKEATELLQKKLEELRGGNCGKLYIGLAGVDDHTKDYERVISMLGMHTEKTIEIGAEDYARYVLDDWDWKEQWMTTNSKYLG